MPGITIDIGGSAELQRALEQVRPEAILKAMREDIANLITNHLARMDSERPNQIGGQRTHFYESAANSVTHSLTDTELRVSIGQIGMRQRYEGGQIVPQNKTWLTIPAVPEAYGKRAGEFKNLEFVAVRGRSDLALLVAKEGGEIGRRRVGKNGSKQSLVGAGAVMFWLKKEVYQLPDHSVLPSEDELRKTAQESVSDYLWALQQEGQN